MRTSVTAMIGPKSSFIAAMAASFGDMPPLDMLGRAFHHHDGVIHHDADGQHDSKESQRIDR